MVRVRALVIDGINLYFPSNNHEPPHFHAQKRDGAWLLKVYIMEPEEHMIEVIRPPDARIHRKDRRAIIEGVNQHRLELILEWEALSRED